MSTKRNLAALLAAPEETQETRVRKLSAIARKRPTLANVRNSRPLSPPTDHPIPSDNTPSDEEHITAAHVGRS